MMVIGMVTRVLLDAKAFEERRGCNRQALSNWRQVVHRGRSLRGNLHVSRYKASRGIHCCINGCPLLKLSFPFVSVDVGIVGCRDVNAHAHAHHIARYEGCAVCSDDRPQGVVRSKAVPDELFLRVLWVSAARACG